MTYDPYFAAGFNWRAHLAEFVANFGGEIHNGDAAGVGLVRVPRDFVDETKAFIRNHTPVSYRIDVEALPEPPTE